jgi:uncharacterized protein
MPLTINLRHLERHSLNLEGELSAQELELENLDELIHVPGTIKYKISVQKIEQSILLQGLLEVVLHCECARCLKPFLLPLRLENWSFLMPLTGEEAVPVNNDIVDLTPPIREDILLGFPQHPLCEAGCSGLVSPLRGKPASSASKGHRTSGSSAWAALDKLKLKQD